MLVSDHTKKLIKLEIQKDDYTFNFCNYFDEETRDFEENKIRSSPNHNFLVCDDGDISREISWPNLSYWQSYRFLDNQKNPYYFLQMSNRRTNSHYQVVINVEVSKIELFKTGTIHRWIMATNEDALADQLELMNQLKYFCKHHAGLMSLRIQPYMPGKKSLESTYDLLSPLGFSDVRPKSYTKTRMIDLRPSVEEMLSSFSANGRARLKIKPKEADNVEVKEIFDLAAIPFLQEALNASYKRSIDKACPYDFTPLFLSATQFPNDVVKLGFYFKDSASTPKAFITGIRHGNVVEYSVGGSLSDTRLRQYPFNHILMWQLALRSKKNGSLLLDMGGITNGAADDALQGITIFKRLFPGFELSTGREMEIIFRSKYIYLYSMIQKIIRKLKRS